MSERRRNTRRHRREPLRRPLQERQRTAAGFTESGPVVAAEDFLLSGYDTFLGALVVLPVELTPLYAMLTAIYHAIGRRASYSGVVASGQLVRGLEHLGFEAELLPACMSVFRLNRGHVGAHISGDGKTSGHLVVWVSSFNRCIDLAVCQDRTLVRASIGDAVLALPVILPVPGGREKLLYGSESIGTERPPFEISWKFFPEWMSRFEPLLTQHTVAIEHGGLALAHVVVDLLSAVAVHQDLCQLGDLYPRLGGLLSGRTHLPKLDDYLSPGESGAGYEAGIAEARCSNLGIL